MEDISSVQNTTAVLPQIRSNGLPWLLIKLPKGMYYEKDKLTAYRLHINKKNYPGCDNNVYHCSECFAVLLSISRKKEHGMVFIVPFELLRKFTGKENFAVGEKLCQPMSATADNEQYGFMYHICLRSVEEGYVLERRIVQDFQKHWIDIATDNWFFGTSKLSRRGLDVLALLILEKFQGHYLVTKQDCLEFSKEFALRVAQNESQYDEDTVISVLKNLTVKEGIEGISEQSSRGTSVGYSFGTSIAFSYKKSAV